MIDTPEQLPDEPIRPIAEATNDVIVKFQPSGALTWLGEAKCKHGAVQNTTYQILPGVPPLNHANMVTHVRRMHAQIVACDCPNEQPRLNATVTFSQAPGVEPGQQRYVPQASGIIEPYAKNNLWWGPGLTCARAGAYAVKAKVQLSHGLTQGAGGLGVVIVQGVPVFSVAMVDEAERATANIDVMLNLAPNQSVNIGYENTSPNVQDVQVTSLMVSEVWVP